MTRINVNAKYDVLQNNRRIRLVDRQNGAVVVDFVAPLDTPGGMGDAMKQAFDAFAPPLEKENVEKTTQKKKKTSRRQKEEWKKELDVADGDDDETEAKSDE